MKFNYDYRKLPINADKYFYIWENEGIPGTDTYYFSTLQEVRDFIFDCDGVYQMRETGRIMTAFVVFNQDDVQISVDAIFCDEDFHSNASWDKIVGK